MLLVEDDFLIALDLTTLLERQGWRVLGPASTVAEALQLLGAQVPDVAVLDVNLGRGELVTPVALALRERGVPYVLATAYDAAELAPPLGGVPNVGKPVGEAKLLAALADA